MDPSAILTSRSEYFSEASADWNRSEVPIYPRAIFIEFGIRTNDL
jgi:hypothetical protein